MAWWKKISKAWGGTTPTDLGLRLEAFQRQIGYRFRDDGLLHVALTHRSHARLTEIPAHPSNERLEFLGDSVLGLVVADFLYRRFPETFEGGLTKQKSLLVNEAALFRAAEALNLGEFILLSPDEERSGGRKRASINADAFEAVIAAIYLDSGLDPAIRFVEVHLLPHMDGIVADDNFRNFKGDLLEHLQAEGAGMPRYEVTSEEGPDHDKVFTVVVYTNGTQIGCGTGTTKKDAEQKAAAQALAHLKRVNAEE